MVKLALRNLWRNPKRSGITIVAITIGIWALVFVWGFVDGMNEQMIVNNVQYMTGHLKIHRGGFHADKELALSLAASDPRIEEALQHPDIRHAAPRVEGPALISAGKESETIMVFGVAPDSEAALTAFDDALVGGRYLDNKTPAMVGEKNAELIIGDKLAEQLAVAVGDRVDLIVQAADGSLGADRFQVIGVYNSGIDALDERLVLIHLPVAQELFSLWGQYTSWLILSDDRQTVSTLQATLAGELGGDYEVLDWRSLLPSVVQSILFHERVAYIVILVVFTVVAVGIANTVLMSVIERTREFGVMLALGTESRQILGMVVIEAVLLGIIGLVAGNVLGIAFTAYWGWAGINLSAYTEAMEAMPGLSALVYPVIRGDHLFTVSAVVFAICILPALAPAWRSSRLQPVTAIRGRTRHDGLAENLESHLHLPGAERTRFLQLAWRNLFRNPRRSLLTAGATAFGMAAFVFLYAFADGFFEQMTENSTKLLTSHLQIKAVSTDTNNNGVYLEQEAIVLLFNELPQSNDYPAIQGWAPRLTTEAIVSSAAKALPIEWYGVQADRERQITDLHNFIVDGRYLESGDRNSVLIGADLADELNLGVGLKMIVTLQTPEGELLSSALRVRGIFNTGSELFDKGYVFSPADDLRELLGLTGDRFSHVAIQLENRQQSQLAAAQINRQLRADGRPTGLVAESWEEIMPVLMQMINMSRLDFYLILAVVFAVVAMGVMNTLLMSVLERTREFGMLLALGTQPEQVLRTVMYEAVILGAIGIGIGALTGTGIAQYYHANGIDLSAFADSMAAIPGMTDKVFPTLIVENLIVPGLLLYVLSIVVATYPAHKAAYMKPVAALHHA